MGAKAEDGGFQLAGQISIDPTKTGDFANPMISDVVQSIGL